ncbi:MAG: PadR family transcriptional regulator [Bacillota bacterium]
MGFRSGLLLPTILLLLKRHPAHGYELLDELEDFDLVGPMPDPAVVYRHLRKLEAEGMVASRLEQGSGGPARKVYSITSEGEGYLRAWVATLKSRKSALERFLSAYREITGEVTEE